MKHSLVLIIALFAFALVGCKLSSATATPMPVEEIPPMQTTPAIEPAQSPASGNSPIAKLQITPPGNIAANAKTYSVTNPTTNTKLNVQVFTPQDSAGKNFPRSCLCRAAPAIAMA